MTFLPDFNSPTAIKLFLESHEMAMQKKFGQNFLIQESSRKKILAAFGNVEGKKIWEVGPGLGAMTQHLLEEKATLIAFEIDKGFSSVLRKAFSPERILAPASFRLVEGDFLKTWEKEWETQGAPDYFFGNLPYNISSQILANTISKGLRFEKAIITVQKELAERIDAKPGQKDYSSFSVLIQWAYNVKKIIDLGPSHFWPRPNVDSRSLLLEKKEDFPQCLDAGHFMELQRALFLSRRKTIKNNLIQFYKNDDIAETVLENANIKANERAENLSLENILYLSDCSYQFLQEKKGGK